jgi:hypothetical protein
MAASHRQYRQAALQLLLTAALELAEAPCKDPAFTELHVFSSDYTVQVCS